MKETSNCVNCLSEFTWYKYDHKPDKKYCSIGCYMSHKKLLNLEHNRITKVCKFCAAEFSVADSVNCNKREFCSKQCMYDNRKHSSHHIIPCNNCGEPISDYKIKTTRMFCSPECQRSSIWRSELSRDQMLYNNPMNDPAKIQKIKDTKMAKYGNPSYNNPEKNVETMIAKYGVKYAFDLHPSNGHRISKPQRLQFKKVLERYPDAILEHYLPDVHISVDIYIPSLKKIVEVYGDYWHCNPNIFSKDMYHNQLHMTANTKWEIDSIRKKKLESAGYTVDVVWESEI